jgi:hypothetical protein
MNGQFCKMKVLLAITILIAFTDAYSQEQTSKILKQVASINDKKEWNSVKDSNSNTFNTPSKVSATNTSAPPTSETKQPLTRSNLVDEQNNEKKNESWLFKFLADPIAVFTGLMLLVNIGLWAATRRLVLGAEDTSRRQLRAYISVEPKDFRILSSENPLGIMVHLINHGNTPAHDVIDDVVISVQPNPLPAEFEFPYPAISVNRTPFVLYPGQPRQLERYGHEPLAVDDLAKLNDGNKFRVYFFGLIRYVDVFNIYQSTKFCIFIEGRDFVNARYEFISNGKSGTMTWFFAENFNDAT